MNWKSTWVLLGLAGGLLIFVVVGDRHLADSNVPPPRLFTFRAFDVTNIQVRLTNQLLLRVERSRDEADWFLTLPMVYPAQPHAIAWVVESLERAMPITEITPQELRASRRTVAEFGLDVPQATLTLQHNGKRTEVFFGAKTPVGDGVYVQVLDHPGIFVLNGELIDHLPRNNQQWRDPALISRSAFQRKIPKRLEVRAGGRGFTLDLDPTNRVYLLTKPISARADLAKLDAFLGRLFSARITSFVTDNPRPDDFESYGLQPPEAEVSFQMGTNDQFVVQFGKSPTNDPASVYALRLSRTNVVLVSRSALEAVQLSHSDLRDLHLAGFLPTAVEAIDVIGTNSFSVRRQTNATWMITEPQLAAADTNSILLWLDDLAKLEGTVEKDIVTDFTPYGLNNPFRKYVLRGSVTNASGLVSDRLLAEIDLGVRQDDKVFARRPDEKTVYSLRPTDVSKLPRASWQLRNHRVWTFTTNQVSRLTVRSQGKSIVLQRNPNAAWSLADGSGVYNSVNPVLEELIARLGELQAVSWAAKADERDKFGFKEGGDTLSIELKNGDKALPLSIEFGSPLAGPLYYAITVVDGEALIFEFPPRLRNEVNRVLFLKVAMTPP